MLELQDILSTIAKPLLIQFLLITAIVAYCRPENKSASDTTKFRVGTIAAIIMILCGLLYPVTKTGNYESALHLYYNRQSWMIGGYMGAIVIPLVLKRGKYSPNKLPSIIMICASFLIIHSLLSIGGHL